VSVPYTIIPTTRYLKDVKRLKRQGFDSDKVKVAVIALANGKLLPAKYRDHSMTSSGNLRNCHIAPDVVLLYETDRDNSTLTLFRVGSQSDLLLSEI
jgi:mRNA interferase YafQ